MRIKHRPFTFTHLADITATGAVEVVTLLTLNFTAASMANFGKR
jgi:hypothetical protein